MIVNLVVICFTNWISEQEAISKIKQNPQTPLYSNSENALNWIEQYLGDTKLSNQVKTFKNKAKFRAMTQAIFPDFQFRTVKLEDIQQLSSENLTFPFVIKPTVGFFSIGVHIVENDEDWEKAKMELMPEKLESIFPKNVLDTTNFIIEDFIHGEEYAIDYYYNKEGEVVVLNVMHHLFSSETDTSDRVYSTSNEIINEHKIKIEYFLTKIGEHLKLKNFPAHAEIRIDATGKIVPIEINPLRFGGWCTTGDLLGIALEYNTYKHFIENRKPAWNQLFVNKEDKKFSIIVLDNNSGIKPANIDTFNYTDLANDFENPLLIRKLNIKKYPVFGFVFAESSPSNNKELDSILTSDLKKYITSA